MKTEAEIRKHRDNLRICQKLPCQCIGTAHEQQCMEGSLMMEATHRTLSWVLGENESMADLVERMDAEAKRFR